MVELLMTFQEQSASRTVRNPANIHIQRNYAKYFIDIKITKTINELPGMYFHRDRLAKNS